MASSAPMGPAIKPHRSSASHQPRWLPTVRCENAHAPMEMNDTSHSDTCPEVRTSSPSDMNTIDIATNVVQSVRWTPANPGTNSRNPISAIPPVSCSDPGARQVGRVVGTVNDLPTRYLRGNTSSTPNSTMYGIPTDSVERNPVVNHFVHSAERTPIPRPPANVTGMFVKPPIAAAPNAETTSSVSWPGPSSSTGANSPPAAAASVIPMIHASRRVYVGLVPAMSSSSGLSTTARIALPWRATRKKIVNTTVTTTANRN